MKLSILLLPIYLGILMALAPMTVVAQEPLDCSRSLDPRTPYHQTLIGCPIANTPNNLAAKTISDTKWKGAAPTVKQCQVDLTAWLQADDDWNKRERVRIAKKSVDREENPLPITLLSVEELYRRSQESSLCVLYLSAEATRSLDSAKKKLTPLAIQTYDGLQQQVTDMLRERANILGEQLSRAESVIDQHFLWNDLLTAK